MTGLDFLSALTYISRYSRPSKGCYRYEDSVVYLAKCLGVPQQHWDTIRSLAARRLLFPSMRGVQFLDAIYSKAERLYNCAGILIRSLKDISNVFYLLLCGCGVGFNISRRWISELPRVLPGPMIGSRGQKVHVVEDDVAGWAEAARVVLESYFENQPLSGYDIVLDFSRITPKGRILPSCDRPAPGHEPLQRCLDAVRAILRSAAGRQLRSIEVYDVITTLASAVVAGGVRRSALLCCFDKDDEAMMNAKVGQWWKDYPYRAYSNNSFILTPDDVRELGESGLRAYYESVLDRCLQYGEPGVVHLPSYAHVVNPCCEIVFYPVLESTSRGIVSSYQLCNLTEVNLSGITKEPDLVYQAVRYAALLGTYQAAVSWLRDDVAAALHSRDRLLGVSLTGGFTWLHRNRSEAADVLKSFRQLVYSTNLEVANDVGIVPAARSTCIKPSGTVSCLAGTSSGVHPWYARHYLRNVRFSQSEAAYRIYRAMTGYDGIVDSLTGSVVCPFPIEADGLSWQDVSWQDVLSAVSLIYDSYVAQPSRPRCDFTNSVSCTLLFEPSDIKAMASALASESWLSVRRSGKFRFVGLSFLSRVNDFVSDTMPFLPVSSDGNQSHWNLYQALCHALDTVSYEDVVAAFRLGNEHGLGEMNGGCDGDFCAVRPVLS